MILLSCFAREVIDGIQASVSSLIASGQEEWGYGSTFTLPLVPASLRTAS
ncbi:hypothetical protein RchiOBHm_Chr1g0343201 [Rosa chinensis]|uniref:Uncharacterized protein n=1 Tax=Rosa chinensis TaxID=74649 RepID=A0A2P6SE77_ROSCH|nr:hypothetical protein RchiOBHm_Chr1g0343201 [Rosa chinensis]